MKIGNKFILIISILVVVSILVVGGISYNLAKRSIEERVKSQLESVSILKRNQFENFIESISSELIDISAKPYIIDILSQAHMDHGNAQEAGSLPPPEQCSRPGR